MLKVNGYNIGKLPFENLVLISEILSFEDIPILSHYTDEKGHDIISYWVDFDESGNRILYGKVTKGELFNYLVGSISLKNLITNISSEYLFLTDYDIDGKIKSVQFLNKYILPEKYLPKEESYYTEKLSDFYESYLTEFSYLHKLRENSYVLKVEPKDKVHLNTVGAKEAAFILENATNSIEGYIKVKAFNILKNDFGDSSRINKRINKIKERLSPRISESAFGSFEVWLAIDTITFHGEDKYDSELRNTIIESYKQEVLDVDYTSEEEAQIITNKYTIDERKLIFEPLFKIFQSEEYSITINDTKNSIKRKFDKIKIETKFKDIIFPKPTIDELTKEIEKKNRIISLVINLKEGEDITKINKKELFDNLIFKQDLAEAPIDIHSPIITAEGKAILVKPIRCILKVDHSGKLQLSNSELELFEEGTNIQDVIKSIKEQFISLVNNIELIAEIDYPKSIIVNSYLGKEI